MRNQLENKQIHFKKRPFIFLIIVLSHFLFGILAILASIKMSTSTNTETKMIAGIIFVISISLFASTQPDYRNHKIESNWPFIDKFING